MIQLRIMQASVYPPLSTRVIKDHKVKPWQVKTIPDGTARGKYRNWNEASMLNAVEAVTKQGSSVRRAAELYSVPKSTLSDKVLGKVPLNARSGPSTYLTVEEEELTSYFWKWQKLAMLLQEKK